MANAEVYSFSGTNSPEAALNYLNQYVSSAYGGGLQYQKSGSAGGYQVYNGNTSIPNVISINWVAAFKPQGNNKLAGLILGTNAQSGKNSNIFYFSVFTWLYCKSNGAGQKPG